VSAYVYNITADTANGRVNVEVLVRAILDAGLASGGNFEGAEIADGTLDDTRAGVVDGGTLTVSWENVLSGPDETAQDSLVSAHQGDGFAVVDPISDESLSVSSTSTSITKLTLTPTGPLAEGTYEISGSAEVRTQAVIAGSFARGSVLLDAGELIQHNNPDDAFQAFGITMLSAFEAGEIPVIEIQLEAIGPPNTVEIMNARLSLARVS